MNRIQFSTGLLAIALGALGSSSAIAQQAADTFPNKPITIVLPNQGGTTMDIEIRLFTQSILENAKVQVVVEAKPGAGTTIASAYVARAKPDGYTILGTNASFTIVPAVYPDLPFDNIKSFSPITLLDKHPFVVLVNPSSPYKTITEYLAYVRANPDALNYSTSGVGGVTHLAGVLLHYLSGTKVTYIHYKSSTERLTDVIAGRAHISMTAPTAAMPLINSGKLRPIGVTTDQRVSPLPNVGTVEEQGVPGYEFTSWIGVLGPANLPAPILNKLNQLWIATIKDPKVIKRLESDGTIMVGNTPAQFRQAIVTETERWRKVIKETGVQVAD